MSPTTKGFYVLKFYLYLVLFTIKYVCYALLSGLHKF